MFAKLRAVHEGPEGHGGEGGGGNKKKCVSHPAHTLRFLLCAGVV